MEYNEVQQRLNEMKSRFNDGFSSTDREYLDSIYAYLFKKEIPNKKCGDCYRDAFILISSTLKRENKMPTPSDYTLKAGAIIQFFGEREVYSNVNLTNEVAERYLSLNPNNILMFSAYPADYENRVAEYLHSQIATEEETESAPSNEAYAELQSRFDELAKVNNELSDSLAKEIEEKNVLKAEVDALKSEIRALKSANTRLKKKAEDTPSEEKVADESTAPETPTEEKAEEENADSPETPSDE